MKTLQKVRSGSVSVADWNGWPIGSVVIWCLVGLGLTSFIALLLTAQASYYLEQAIYFTSTLISWAVGG